MADEPSPLDAVRATLREPRPYTLAEVAERAEVAEADLARLFPVVSRDHEDGRYGETDVAYARDLGVLLHFAPFEIVERESRMRQRVVSQIVVNDLATVRLSHMIDEALADGASPQDLGGMLAHIAETVLPAVGRLLAADHRQVLARLLDSDVVEQASYVWDQETVEMAVGFVDLVGFTRLSAATDPEGLGSVLTAFERLAGDAARDRGDVLVAKTIGDAVMFVGGDPDAMVDVLLTVVLDEPAGLEDIGRRAGMAFGDVIVRDGDYVGTTVNLAARLTDLARPSSLVVTDHAADRLADAWQRSRLPPVKLKGIGTRRPIRVRPPDPG